MEEVDSKDMVKVERSGGNDGGYNRSELPDLLRVYYKWLFPYDKYFEWLQYGEKRTQYVHRYILYMVCTSLGTRPFAGG